jgi:hypothetical protein
LYQTDIEYGSRIYDNGEKTMQRQKRLGKETVMKEWDAFCVSVLAETRIFCGENRFSDSDLSSTDGIPDPVLDGVLVRVLARVHDDTRQSAAEIPPALYNALQTRISEATEGLLSILEYERGLLVPESQSVSEALRHSFHRILVPHIEPARHI